MSEEEIDHMYSTYVHIGNSGYTFKTIIEECESGKFSQHLVTSLHAFGHEHETTLFMDDNVLAALEYIVECAKKQRSDAGWGIELKENHVMTHPPSHLGNEAKFTGDTCDEETSE